MSQRVLLILIIIAVILLILLIAITPTHPKPQLKQYAVQAQDSWQTLFNSDEQIDIVK